MAVPEHVALAKSGRNAIARWRELNHVIPSAPTYSTLNYQLGDRAASETFEREMVYGRPKLDLSGAILSRAKLGAVDLAFDELNGVDLTNSNLRMATMEGTNLSSAHLSRSNLSHAVLTRANMARCVLTRSNLSRITLRAADLTNADLSSTDMTFANLEGANLFKADLSSADLTGADLTGANLKEAILSSTILKQADLTGADLRGASFFKTDLESATFYRSTFGFSNLVSCDLSMTIALDLSRHTGPSTIGLDTLAKSGGRISRKFLEDAGVAAPLLQAQDPMMGVSRTFPSLLAIGSMQDREFADRLRVSLQAAQIQCWSIAPDDETSLQAGETMLSHTAYFDKLVLLCTESSLQSPQTRRYMSELAGNMGPESKDLASLAADSMFDDKEDGLCTLLKQGKVIDFRGLEEDPAFEAAVASLVDFLSSTSSGGVPRTNARTPEDK